PANGCWIRQLWRVHDQSENGEYPYGYSVDDCLSRAFILRADAVYLSRYYHRSRTPDSFEIPLTTQGTETAIKSQLGEPAPMGRCAHCRRCYWRNNESPTRQTF